MDTTYHVGKHLISLAKLYEKGKRHGVKKVLFTLGNMYLFICTGMSDVRMPTPSPQKCRNKNNVHLFMFTVHIHIIHINCIIQQAPI